MQRVKKNRMLLLGSAAILAVATFAVVGLSESPEVRAACPGQVGCTQSQSTQSYTYTSPTSCETAEDVVYLATFNYFQNQANNACGTHKKACNVEFVVEGWCQEVTLQNGETGYRVTGHHEFGCKTCLPGNPHDPPPNGP